MRFNPRAFKTAQDVATTTPTTPNPVILSPERSFIIMYGRPEANRVAIPEHHTAVTLCLKHNDSAPQVDHFDHHAPLGCPAFLLLLEKKGARISPEALARQALSLAPDLHRLDWKWHTENYAGGHGNYLQSSPFPFPLTSDLLPLTSVTGLPVTTVFWEIEFAGSHRGHTLELWPHRYYGAKPLMPSDLCCPTAVHNVPITATSRLNPKFNGIEIHFSRRPEDAALNPLRADRAWRYTGATKCWYAKQNPQTLAFAETFCAQFNEPSLISEVEPSPCSPVLAAALPVRKLIRFVDLTRRSV